MSWLVVAGRGEQLCLAPMHDATLSRLNASATSLQCAEVVQQYAKG